MKKARGDPAPLFIVDVRTSVRGRSPKLAALAAFAGPLDLLTRYARHGSQCASFQTLR